MHADAAAQKPLTVRLTALNSTIDEAPFAAHASMMWHVEIARELARSGIASLRFDLAGIGDSEASPHGTPHLYGALSEDMRAAIDWLHAHGIRDLTVFGTYSGAYQAFHAAVSDRRIASIALVNQLCFIWGPPTQCSSKRGGAPKRDRNRSSRRRAKCGHRAAKRAWIVGAWSAAGEAAGEIRPPACGKSVRAGKHGVERQESGRALVRRLIETA
jgi:alpha-beta hydrolase superfamily lysophospholipase